jgi:hypothetical protein
VRRREFIRLLGGAAAAFPLAARAQQGERMRRIGVLRFTTQDQAVINSLLRGLQTLGYVDGKNVAIEYRDAEGDYGRFSKAVDELVRLNPDVIFSFGGEQAPVVKAATSSIPIVVVVSNDPVESGLVASLARPGGNITGVTYVHDMLAGKSVELLRDTAPWVSRIAILWNPGHVDPEFRETQRASRALDVQIQSLEVRAPSDFEGAFQAAVRERAEALIVIGRPAPGHASANLNIDINSRSAWKREAVPLRRDWPDRRHRSRSVDDIAPSQCWPRCPPKYPDRRCRRAGPAGPASRSHPGKIRQFALVRSADHDGCLIRRSLRFLHARSLPIPLPRSKLHRAKSK